MEENQDPANCEKVIRKDPTAAIPTHRPECMEEYGSWMLVKKPSRRKNSKNSNGNAREKIFETPNPTDPKATRTRPAITGTRENGKNGKQGEKSAPDQPCLGSGSRYAILDNITEDPQQGSLEIIAILENDMVMEGSTSRIQELIKEENITKDNAHNRGTKADL